MAAETVLEANAALAAGNPDEAMAILTGGVKSDPSSEIYIARGSIFMAKKDYDSALDDFDAAVRLNKKSGFAQYKKGEALFKLEEYESAKESFQAAMGCGYVKDVDKWIGKCDAEIRDEDGDTVSMNGQASVEEKPAPAAPAVDIAPNAPAASAAESVRNAPAASSHQPDPESQAPPEKPPKFRFQWFQLPNTIQWDLYVKKLAREHLTVELTEASFKVTVRRPEDDEDWVFETSLYGKIDVEASKWTPLSTKLEVKLKKADPVNWPSLEAKDAPHVPASGNWSDPLLERPSYPSSHIRNPKDWSKVEQAVTEELKNDKPEGEEALKKLFQDIYGQGDEDSRRAMYKSFIESNGTVLSTNWKEVGAKKIECTPPDGMELKKFEI